MFELLIGLGMEKLFGARWWDYSNKKFNFRGSVTATTQLIILLKMKLQRQTTAGTGRRISRKAARTGREKSALSTA